MKRKQVMVNRENPNLNLGIKAEDLKVKDLLQDEILKKI
jgi:hypothetical protein